jgi:hypothetical protein
MKKALLSLTLITLLFPLTALLAEEDVVLLEQKQDNESEASLVQEKNTVAAEDISGPLCTTPLTLDEAKEALSSGDIVIEKPDATTGTARITNKTDCPFPVSLVAYAIDDPSDIADPNADGPGPEDITHQTLSDATHKIIAAKSSETLQVSLPSCNFQLDVFYDNDYPEHLDRGNMSPAFLDDGKGNTYAINMEEFGGNECPCSGQLTLEQTKKALADGEIIFEKPDTDTGTAKITNNTDCELPVSLAVFTIDDPSDIADTNAQTPGPDDITFQTLFDATENATIPPRATGTLHVDLPQCNFQMDIYYADNYPPHLDRGNIGPYFLDDLRSNSFAVNLEAFGGNSCTVVPPQYPTLTIIKTVINNNGGTKTALDFSFTISGGTSGPIISGPGTTSGPVVSGPTSGPYMSGPINFATSGILYTLAPGTYSITEHFMENYTAGAWGGDCATSGMVTLNYGDNKICRITNDDNPQGPPPGGNNGTTTPTTTPPIGGGNNNGGGQENDKKDNGRSGSTIIDRNGIGGGEGSDSGGRVLGESTSLPGLPNAGAGGYATMYLINIVLATLICFSGILIAAKRS